MEENKQVCDSKEEQNKKFWIQLTAILVVLFLACYLATYFVLNQMRPSYIIPVNTDNIDKILKEQDKIFKEMTTFPMHTKAIMRTVTPVEMYKDTDTNSYKIIIDLKPFNDNPENIKIDVKNNKIMIKGEEKSTSQKEENLYSFSQSLVLPEEIEEDKITKEVSNKKYIITLPIDD